MKQIEAMIACVAVSGAVLYGPVSRGFTRMESHAAPLVRAAMIHPSSIPAAPAWIAAANLPHPPAAPHLAAHAICPQKEIARVRQQLDKDQARLQRDLAKNNAARARAANLEARTQVRAQMRLADEQIRMALRQAHIDRAAYSVPLG